MILGEPLGEDAAEDAAEDAGEVPNEAEDEEEDASPEDEAAEAGGVVPPAGLNGAQVTAFLNVLKSVTEGTITQEAALITLRSAFPTVSAEDAQRAIESQRSAQTAGD